MEKQDYLQRQIDQLGKVLGELLGKITGSGKNTDASETIEEVSQVLNENLNWNIAKLLDVPKNEFIDTLKKNQLLDDVNIETLADVLVEVAEHHSSNNEELLKRALMMYEYLERSNKTFSFTRNQKMESIKQELSLS
ncbi:MAG: DUF6483 family protein [Bacteroidales bacterium]|jgi:hypothetical protein|nr:DUF6483 family protein [Bacteroidales bacterium]